METGQYWTLDRSRAEALCHAMKYTADSLNAEEVMALLAEARETMRDLGDKIDAARARLGS
jgi:hypothetical protein